MTNRPPAVSLAGTLKRMELNPKEWGWAERSSPARTTCNGAGEGGVGAWAWARATRNSWRPAAGAATATALRNERRFIAAPYKRGEEKCGKGKRTKDNGGSGGRQEILRTGGEPRVKDFEIRPDSARLLLFLSRLNRRPETPCPGSISLASVLLVHPLCGQPRWACCSRRLRARSWLRPCRRHWSPLRRSHRRLVRTARRSPVCRNFMTPLPMTLTSTPGTSRFLMVGVLPAGMSIRASGGSKTVSWWARRSKAKQRAITTSSIGATRHAISI